AVDRLCVSRRDILRTFGPDDDRPHPGYPIGAADARLDQLLDNTKSPYLMTYRSNHPGMRFSSMSFGFVLSHCAGEVDVLTDPSDRDLKSFRSLPQDGTGP